MIVTESIQMSNCLSFFAVSRGIIENQNFGLSFSIAYRKKKIARISISFNS